MQVRERFPGFRLAAPPPPAQPAEMIAAPAPSVLTRSDIGKLTKADILVVLAHPDDETFMAGTLAKLKAQGYKIQLVYSTSGDAGVDYTRRGLQRESLGRVRENELSSALFHELHIDRPPVMLRYPDGQTSDHVTAITRDVETILNKTRPRLVLTFGPDGYTGHRDHINVGRIADSLARRLGKNVYHTAISDTADDIFKHAFRTDPASSWRHMNRTPDEDIAVRVNVTDALPIKHAAQMHHETQFKLNEIASFREFQHLYPVEEFTKDTFTRYHF